MDFLLDDETVEKMNEEYSKVLSGAVGTLCVGDDLSARCAEAEAKTIARALLARVQNT